MVDELPGEQETLGDETIAEALGRLASRGGSHKLAFSPAAHCSY
jgi:hypothetical protein